MVQCQHPQHHTTSLKKRAYAPSLFTDICCSERHRAKRAKPKAAPTTRYKAHVHRQEVPPRLPIVALGSTPPTAVEKCSNAAPSPLAVGHKGAATPVPPPICFWFALSRLPVKHIFAYILAVVDASLCPPKPCRRCCGELLPACRLGESASTRPPLVSTCPFIPGYASLE